MYFLKNSLSHRGAILWNIVSNYYIDYTFENDDDDDDDDDDD